jgi:xanthine dehydrogenase accessory factor
VTVLNTCLSGGAIEVFLEPTLPIPRVNVVGSKPIAAEIERLGAEFDLEVVATGDEPASVREGDLAMVIAAHGKGELEALKAAIGAKLPYIGLVASPKRGKALLEELRAEGLAEEDLARVKCPAGINIGARTAPEVALTVLAELIETRYSENYTAPVRAPQDQVAPTFAIDPICGMTVVAEPGTLHLDHAGETVYFCAPACKKSYEEERLSGPPPSSEEAPAPTGMPSSKVATAVDPVCGMTVLATDDTLHLDHDGERVYFCREECKATFEREQHAVGAA